MTATVESTDIQDGGAAMPEGRAEAIKQLQRREGWKRRLPLLPALLFTILVTQVPFGFSLFYSLTDWTINPPSPRQFIWFENYTDLFGQSGTFFRRAALASIWMTTSSVVGSILVGLGLALLLDRKFLGQGLARTLLITPFLVMPVVAGLVWSTQMFNATFGVLNWFIDLIGLERVEFVSRFPLWSIVAVLIWQWSPFMMLILLAGLQGQSPSVLEAARVDGATPRAIFFQITLPHLRRYIELGILLGAIYLIQVFDHIEVMTGGAVGSQNLPHFVFERSIGGGWRFGQASAFSIVVVIATIIIATIGLRTLSNLLEGEEPA